MFKLQNGAWKKLGQSLQASKPFQIIAFTMAGSGSRIVTLNTKTIVSDDGYYPKEHYEVYDFKRSSIWSKVATFKSEVESAGSIARYAAWPAISNSGHRLAVAWSYVCSNYYGLCGFLRVYEAA
mmetsp:Transcript_40687/g.95511  ORF Transcript_40687/g.95511 Transcript_40687/m.95511 type:complete len:124 (+) Transcript_40687:664-1035(+)